MKKSVRNCLICGEGLCEVIRHIDMQLPKEFHLPPAYDVVTCSKCGCCYADTEAAQADYDYYYAQCNVYSGRASSVIENPNFIWFDQKLDELFGDEKYSKNILDMGFGKGEFLDFLKAKGYQSVYGIDPSEESVKAICQQGIHAYQGSIYDDVKPDFYEKMDVVFLVSVLEHLLYPELALDRISDLLKESSYFIFAIPNYGNMDKDNTPAANNFNQEHINYFSSISVTNLLRKKGFSFVDKKERSYHTEQGEYLELLMVFQKKVNEDFKIEKDDITWKSIRDYFSRYDARQKQIQELLQHLANTQEPIVIWGVGAYVMSLYQETMLKKCNIVAYTDNNPLKIGKEFQGKLILSPTELKQLNAGILICSMLYGNEIQNQIKEMGLQTKVYRIS